MEVTTGLVAAVALALLWSAEALGPGLLGPAPGLHQRLRHVFLGLLNAAAGILAAGAFLLVDTPAARADFGLLRVADIPLWLAAIAGLLLLDLWQYVCHITFHHVPLLWRFHAVHHNADSLEATVALRFHVLEILAHGLLVIPFAVLLGISIETAAIYNLVLLPASLFHHSNLRISPALDRLLRLVIVTPRMHWLHHSRWQPETDSNYSSVLSIWDRLFGTMRSRRHPETVDIGLDGYDPRQIASLRGIMTTPFHPATSEHGQRPASPLLEPDSPALPGLKAGRRARGRSLNAGPSSSQA